MVYLFACIFSSESVVPGERSHLRNRLLFSHSLDVNECRHSLFLLFIACSYTIIFGNYHIIIGNKGTQGFS